MFKVNINTPERRQWRRSGVFIVNFEHIPHVVLVFLLLTFNKYLAAEMSKYGMCNGDIFKIMKVVFPYFYHIKNRFGDTELCETFLEMSESQRSINLQGNLIKMQNSLFATVFHFFATVSCSVYMTALHIF